MNSNDLLARAKINSENYRTRNLILSLEDGNWNRVVTLITEDRSDKRNLLELALKNNVSDETIAKLIGAGYCLDHAVGFINFQVRGGQYDKFKWDAWVDLLHMEPSILETPDFWINFQLFLKRQKNIDPQIFKSQLWNYLRGPSLNYFTQEKNTNAVATILNGPSDHEEEWYQLLKNILIDEDIVKFKLYLPKISKYLRTKLFFWYLEHCRKNALRKNECNEILSEKYFVSKEITSIFIKAGIDKTLMDRYGRDCYKIAAAWRDPILIYLHTGFENKKLKVVEGRKISMINLIGMSFIRVKNWKLRDCMEIGVGSLDILSELQAFTEEDFSEKAWHEIDSEFQFFGHGFNGPQSTYREAFCTTYEIMEQIIEKVPELKGNIFCLPESDDEFIIVDDGPKRMPWPEKSDKKNYNVLVNFGSEL